MKSMIKKSLLLGACLAASITALNGCAYRTDLAQGNFVEQSAVDQLRYGMTTEQVQYVLGTPMLTDPFDNSRWYYVHFLRHKWEEPEIKNLIVLFQGRTLVDIGGDFKKPATFHDSSSTIQKIDFSKLNQASSQSTSSQNRAVPSYAD